MKLKTRADRHSASTLPAQALSAVIAHELNNIAVPLRGFIDLTLQTKSADDLLQQPLDEFRVGLDRIGALAYQLESLAQQGSTRAATTVGACLSSMEQLPFEDPPQAMWSCRQDTPVKVDLDHIRRAILSLTLLAGPEPLLIADSALNGQACAACGKPFGRGRILVEVQARGVRPGIFAAIRAPFDEAHKLRAMQRLSIAALTHCTHLAGGHVLAHPHAKSLSIILPR